MTVTVTEALDQGVHRTALANGAIVISERMEHLQSVAVGLWVRQGRAHEEPAEAGASHFLEHMAFKGTQRRSAHEIAWDMARLGGTLDAWTSHELTAFQARVCREDLDAGLDLLCDLVFNPRLASADFELERKVILEEIAASEDQPEEVAFERHARFMFAGHPYGEPVLGTMESIEQLTVDVVAGVHRRAYHPGNVCVVAVGAVEHEALLESLGKLLPRGDGEGFASTPAPPAGNKGSISLERFGGHQAHIVTGALSVPYEHPLRYPLRLTATAFGEGMNSRLFRTIREERGLAYSVYGFHGFFPKAGHLGAYVGTRPTTASEARDRLLAEFKALADEGLDEAELTDTKRQLKGQLVIALESPVTRMNRLAGVGLYNNAYQSRDEVVARIDAVDSDDCLEAASYFAPDRLATLLLIPAEGSPAEIDESE